ncbi:50S ribosomal protein L35 [bacterium]|jgi:large subunit ribosomal protein L35|nr:50S ribosomal protein L35 [bacterium]MBT4292216.1 50S ribosomal protein L35 [bacterium]MCP4145094.1 50S ribosomal protein L35 [bacterium]MCP4799849.1 50S ribosomal protein L35 [bacterium]
MKGPKMKTNRAAAKRMKRTGSGKLKRSKAFHGHLLTSKDAKRKRGLRKSTLVAPADMARANKMLAGSK